MKRVCLHIGYPKCLSTTLQRSFFGKHPQINYAGVGIDDNISYINRDIEFIFESLLKYATDSYWNQNKNQARKVIGQFVDNSNLMSLFSSEHLVFRFSQQQIDSLEKIKRLAFLFSDFEVSILVIKREPISLLKSLYGEFVKMGYKDSYSYFIKETATFSDRNFLSDLNILNKKSQIKDHFPEVKVNWVNFENLIKGEEYLNVTLSRILKLDNYKLSIKNDNPSISNEQLTSILKYNQMYPRELGLSQYEPFERHRNRIVYEKSGLDYREEEVFNNVIKKRLALDEVYKIKNKTTINASIQTTGLEELILQKVKEFNP